MKEKLCPILMLTRDGENNCLREDCAWWDAHYNCCAILSNSVLLEAIIKRKGVKIEEISQK